MARATWKGVVIAASDRCEILEGNVYFPEDAVDRRYLRSSTTHTSCAWKGTASYYDVVVGEDVNADAAWYYPQPSAEARQIAGHIAFWHGVTVER